MQVLSGKHRGHAARLGQFAGDRLTADCVTCKVPGIELRPSQVTLSGPEITRMRESYESFARGGRRDAPFWQSWRLADGGVLARRQAGQ